MKLPTTKNLSKLQRTKQRRRLNNVEYGILKLQDFTVLNRAKELKCYFEKEFSLAHKYNVENSYN